MRGGALPPALACAALGLALCFAGRRAAVQAIALMIVCAVGASLFKVTLLNQDGLFLACWIAVVLSALAVHLPRGVGPRTALLLGANTGVWAGAVIAVAGARTDLLKSLPFVLLCAPGMWLVSRRWGLAIKVVSSWLIAVAILAAALPLTPTPGYVADHME